MADDIIDFDGFEKYGPIANASTFVALANANLVSSSVTTPMLSQSFLQEWLSEAGGGNGAGSIGMIQGLNGFGIALVVSPPGAGNATLTRSLPSNYVRIIVGWACMTNLTANAGIILADGGTLQCSVYVDSSGRINVARGGIPGTVLYQSAGLILANTRRYIELDVTINNSTGAFQVRLDGNSLTTMTSQNTRGGTNNYVNQLKLYSDSTKMGFDDLYWRDNTTGTGTFLGDVSIRALTPTSDNTVQFSPAASVVGPWYAQQVSATNAAGANQLVLVPVTPAVNLTVNSIGILPQATSATAKFKGVIYSDSAGAPNTLLSSGTEAVGTTTGVILSLALVTPQALTGGTQYWIGYITDTSLVIQQSDSWTALGQRAANTYGSGAPATAPAMTTGQVSWSIWGNATGAASNYVNLTGNPPPIVANVPLAYNQDATVGQSDLFNTSDLTVTPSLIYSVKVSVMVQRSDSGARTIDIEIKSSSTTGSGSAAGQTPPTTMNWLSSRFDVDPATSAAWSASAVNAMLVGYKVAS